MQPANLPRRQPLPVPRAGEEGGLAAGATLYTVRHHGYLMKPLPGIQCGNARFEPILYLPDRHNDGLIVHHRDTGDRWVFGIAATYPSEDGRVEAVVTVGCNAGREAATSPGIQPTRTGKDKEA